MNNYIIRMILIISVFIPRVQAGGLDPNVLYQTANPSQPSLSAMAQGALQFQEIDRNNLKLQQQLQFEQTQQELKYPITPQNKDEDYSYQLYIFQH